MRKFAFAIAVLTLVALNAKAQNPNMAETLRPLEVSALVQQVIVQQRFAESKEKDYVFQEDFRSNKLNRDCTWSPDCLGNRPDGSPMSNGYMVLQYTERDFEIFWLDEIRVARVLPPCDRCSLRAVKKGDWTLDIPISDSELSAENQRVEVEIAGARALRAQGKDVSSPVDPPKILLSRMMELCTLFKSSQAGSKKPSHNLA